MGYHLPTNTDYVSCSWQCHLNRNPPSSEAGTDYGSAYGSPCYAVDNGTVVNIKTSSSGATGRFIEYRLDDGRTTRPLHLSAIYVQIGWRVQRGAVIGLTGASGYGSDWYYGAHVHQTLWPGSPAFCCPTIDFALYVGGSTPPPEPPKPTPVIPQEKTMLLVQNKETGHAYTVGLRFLHHCSAKSEANVAANLYNNGVSWKKTSSGWISLEQNYFDYLLRANGVPTAVQNDVLGGKSWQDGTLLSSSVNSTAWSANKVSDISGHKTGDLLAQGWERSGKAATRSQEILDILNAPPTTPVQ